MSKKKAYYARSIDQYDKEHDNHCIKELENLGFEVVDPNKFFTKEEYDEKGMQMFFDRIKDCDVFFFKSIYQGGKITAGVFKEYCYAQELGIPAYEIPFNVSIRSLTVEGTRQYLKDKGVR